MIRGAALKNGSISGKELPLPGTRYRYDGSPESLGLHASLSPGWLTVSTLPDSPATLTDDAGLAFFPIRDKILIIECDVNDTRCEPDREVRIRYNEGSKMRRGSLRVAYFS